jgi:hypothetical protein
MATLPETTRRVVENTSDPVNEKIRERTERRIAGYTAASRATLDRRIEKLQREWDIERSIETFASGVILTGLGLGTFANRKWYALSAVASAFLLQHALQGWCPPVPLFRRLGVRTQSEIEQELYALKVLRGDFAGVEAGSGDGGIDVQRLLQAVELRERPE